MNTSPDLRKPWQRTRWVQALAILLGYTPPLVVFILQIIGESATAQGYMIYAMGYTLFIIAVQLLILWFLCGEKPKMLNFKPGKWWKDLVAGIVLVMITLSVKFLFDPLIAKFFYRASDIESSMVALVNTLADTPWLAALFLGPAVIFVACSEELTRVFFITRWQKIFSSRIWLVVGVFLSAFLFGLNHIAQGYAGIISVTLNGLIMVLWYLRFGRIFPLIIAHYLYDAIQLVPAVVFMIIMGFRM